MRLPLSPDRSALREKIRKSCDAFAKMAAEEQVAIRQAQRESWVRGEMALDRKPEIDNG